MRMEFLQNMMFGQVPGWVWACLLAVQCLFLVVAMRRHWRPHEIGKTVLFLVIAMQATIAAIAAILTDTDILNDFACIVGGFGMLLMPVVAIIEIVIFLILWKKGRDGVVAPWRSAVLPIVIWSILKSMTWIVLSRSALLCTV